MIFVTVGHQMPFDRLIRAVDAWAETQRREDVFAQIGTTDYEPGHLTWAPTIPPEEFRSRVSEADAVVSHAGMGTILTSLELGTPILVMPRQGKLLETRNDHQVATAERLKATGRVHVAMDEEELRVALEGLVGIKPLDSISPWASEELLHTVRGFITDDE